MYCSVPGCSSNANRKHPGQIMYSFPARAHEKEVRERWIAAINRKNPDGTPWQPGKRALVCNKHFIGGKKSTIPSHPSSVPSIFLNTHKKQITDGEAKRKLDRFERFMKRRSASISLEAPNSEDRLIFIPTEQPNSERLELQIFEAQKYLYEEQSRLTQYTDRSVQVALGWVDVDFCFYVNREGPQEVGTQCNVSTTCPFQTKKRKKVDVGCGPDHADNFQFVMSDRKKK